MNKILETTSSERTSLRTSTMDAHALLTSQGWRGTGNSLHPTNNSIGLSKPLLVSQKQNNLGLGKKQHKTSDMWWMNAFDSSLKGLDTSKQGQVVQTVSSGGLDMVAKGGAKWVGSKGGLYASFVRGECLSGTITPESNEGSEEPPRKKRRRGKNEKESKEERRARKAAKRASGDKELNTAEEVEDGSEQSETKEERRARKATKHKLKAQGLVQDGPDTQVKDDETVEELETKEQRKERKRLKKLAREAEQKELEAQSEKAKKKKRRKE
jgi:nucleolar protein TMA23